MAARFATATELVDWFTEQLLAKVTRWNEEAGNKLTTAELLDRTTAAFDVAFPKFLTELRTARPDLAAWLDREFVREENTRRAGTR